MGNIDHPAHYGGDIPTEPIKVIEAWGLGFCLGNAVKYIARAGKKPETSELEDLQKALWYLQRRVLQLQPQRQFEDFVRPLQPVADAPSPGVRAHWFSALVNFARGQIDRAHNMAPHDGPPFSCSRFYCIDARQELDEIVTKLSQQGVPDGL